MNDRENVRTSSLVPRCYRPILDNKLVTHLFLDGAGHGIETPDVLGYVTDAGLHVLDGRSESSHRGGLAQMLASALDDGVVIRPVQGHGGQGVTVIAPRDRELDLRTAEQATSAIIAAGSGAILTRRLRPHPDLVPLHPESIGTTRILTVWPATAERPSVARPVIHRIGTSRTQPFSSWHDGGLSCEVDLASGKLLSALQQTPDGIRHVHTHPDSAESIVGRVLPDWDEAVELVLGLAATMPGLGYALWELILSDVGPQVIEINHNPGLQMQAHRPLLLDEGVCALLTERDVLESFCRSSEAWTAITQRAQGRRL